MRRSARSIKRLMAGIAPMMPDVKDPELAPVPTEHSTSRLLKKSLAARF
jgi:hypothetical protein